MNTRRAEPGIAGQSGVEAGRLNSAPGQPGETGGVDWRNVGLFYGIAFAGAVLVALLVLAIKLFLGPAANLVAMAATAVLYMPLPLIAGLVVERVARRRPLLATEWHSLRTSFWRTYLRNGGYAIAVILAILAVALGFAWLAGLAGVPGAGHLVAGEEELRQRVAEVVPGLPPATSLPPAALLATGGMLGGIVAGVTINGLFAFGEEYGWRGVLQAELNPLGLWRATLLTGLLWGFWHAPIILLGHNYGAEWGWGILAMIAWVTPLSFLLTWVRNRTKSVLAAAFLHGAYNGTVGVFAFLVLGGHILVAVPMGILMAVALSALAAVVWLVVEPRTASSAIA